MIDLTVAICTYNGETRLPKVLDRLLSQTQTEHFSWEAIAIDNNSSDNTAKIVQQYQLIWPQTYPIKYYFEAKQGLAFARRLAIKKAQGRLIAFLDDDNLPTSNWVASVYSFAQRHPKAGAYGSQIQGEYEIDPPQNFQEIACFLGIIDRGIEPFRYDLLARWLFPSGAGLAIRKQAWLESVPENPILTGVTGTSLSSKGEDIESLSYLRKKGWQIWHNPEMKMYHQIPKERFQKAYLVKLFRGVGLSRYPTRMLQIPTWKAPLMLLVYLVSDLGKLIVHYYQYRHVFKTDLVALCQLELLIYSLLSPVYHWQQGLSSLNPPVWSKQPKNQSLGS